MIYLTSSLHEVADHLFENDLIAGDSSKVLFIETAATESIEEGTDEWLERDLDGFVRNGLIPTRYSIVDKTTEDVRQAVDTHDIIYFSGGNTVFLLQHLHLSGALDVVRDAVRGGKPYVGTSAGSIAACPELPNYLYDEGEPLENYGAFGFTNFILGGHWGTESFFKDAYLTKRLPQGYRRDQYPLVLLTDYQYIVSDGEKFRLVDINRV